jgi:nicotinamidase/pyrazinamidase
MNKDLIWWNVDTQIDFVNSDGKLSVLGAEEIKPALLKLTVLAKENNIQVINTCDWHDENTEEISDKPDFITTFPEHCMQNTVGAEFVDETIPENPLIINHINGIVNKPDLQNYRNIILRKDKFDIFSGNSSSNKIVNMLKQKTFIVYGVAENVCVDFAVKGLIERGKEVYVVSDAIKGLPGIESPVNYWIQIGVKMISLKEVEELTKKN